ncbi:MAG TPA: hypothetical protein VIK04_03475 [Solirubrobacteraceae bacterium]
MRGSGPRSPAWIAVLVCAIVAVLPAAAAARQIYRSPGYRWNHKLPKVAPVIPGKLIKLGDGQYPHVVVDAAGTGQIAYSSGVIQNFGPSVVRDCVLPRGQTGCTANAGLVPAEGGDPQYNIDYEGPTPLVIGNQLLMIDHRYPNPETLPDGTTGYPEFLWTSEDGGRTFTGPGIIGNLAASGNAVVFGGDNPQIGVITDTMTGGTIFQATPPGAYTSNRLNLGDQGPDEAYDGRLALDGTEPVAEFQDLSNHIYIREYNGTGDINSSSSWSVAEVNGQGYSRLVGGVGGVGKVWLLYQKTYSGPLFVLRIVHGVPTGAASRVTPTNDFLHVNYAITEDATGRLTVGWFTGGPDDLYVASSTDGRHWTAPQLIAKNLSDPTDLSIGAAGDGGGFAAFQAPDSGSPTGSQIDVAAFGSFAVTGLKGLGNLDGDGIGGLGGDPLGSVSCTDVHFGDIDAIAEAGCFLRDPRNPNGGAAIIQGEIRLNGLEIIPDAGVQIVIDPRQHTINTTGSVRVVLRAPGIGDITLYHGSLNISLSGSLADAGQTLFDFNTATASALEGFPFATGIDVKIAHDAVVIPVSLKLPDYMGKVTGSATLLADNASGFQLTSLHIGVPDLVLGALEVKDLNIDYTQMGDQWAGSATLNIPAGTPYFAIAVAVRFDNGDFTMGSFNVTVPFPGVPIFTDTFLNGFGGGFDIHPDRRSFHGSVSIGAMPLDDPNYTIGVTGTVTITFISGGPVVLEVDGSGSVHGLQVATAKLLFQTNGYFEVDGNLDVDLSVAELQASLSAFADLPAKEFSAQINGSLSIAGYSAIGIEGVISSKGVAACGSYLGAAFGLYYAWGDSPSAGFGCDVSPYVIQPVSKASAAGRGARAVVAAVPMVAGSAFEDLAVTGSGASPSVVLHGPGGQAVTPVKLGPGADTASAALALPDANDDTTYVVLHHPAGGTWTVSPAPGSSPITSVKQARGYAPAKVHARVSGHGATRRLTYSIAAHPGMSVSFAERAHREFHILGTARGSRGTLRFAPGAGVAGSRTVYALVSENGVARETLKVATYRAPVPAVPGRARGLRVRRHGRRFTVSFSGAPGAAYYLEAVIASDGRHLLHVVRGRHHALTLSVIGYQDHLRVSVTGVSVLGKRGRAASGHV